MRGISKVINEGAGSTWSIHRCHARPIQSGWTSSKACSAPIRSAPSRACALAVSGGSDSTALMVLFADWLRQRRADAGAHTVLTVDHGLRPESAAEARAVADQAAALGFRHALLVWRGPKPSTGLQAAAREARYQLMRDYMGAHDIATLFTAHTRDDQAETLLMRLARGSGLDGLAAIAPSIEAGPYTRSCAANRPAAARGRQGAAASHPGSPRHPVGGGPEQPVAGLRAYPLARRARPISRRSACRARCWPRARGDCSGHARRSIP